MAQSGRAQRSGRWGRRFKSSLPDQFKQFLPLHGSAQNDPLGSFFFFFFLQLLQLPLKFLLVSSVMTKIGRNQPCPCGSGRKYKHCCLQAEQAVKPAVPAQTAPVAPTLKAEIAKLQQTARQQEAKFWELGVFLFFSTTAGDGWLLEVTETDAVQVAQAGVAIDLPIEENAETIAINWTHTFKLIDKQVVLTSYASGEEEPLPQAPAQQINAAIRRIRKRYDQALLDQVHLTSGGEER